MSQVHPRVAERIYYDHSETLAFSAVVTAIREVRRTAGQQIWQLALDRTAFYPESGGQPFDIGVLTATARSGASLDVPITDVQEDENGEVWHTTTKPLQEGTPVQAAVDGARRLDHTQQHSGQHLLSAVLWREYRLQTVSFHLGPEICTIDLEGGPLPDEALASAAAAVNRVVAQALPLSTRYVTQEDAATMLQDGRLRKLPPRPGSIRLIEIPELDLNACGGTHVRTTAEIGPVLLRGTERVRGAVRLHFVCGGRALQAAQNDHRLLTDLAAALSTGTGELKASVSKLQTDGRAAAKERSALLHLLAEAEAGALAQKADATQELFALQLDPLLPGRTADYAKSLASALLRVSRVPRVLVALPQGEACALAFAAQPGTVNCGEQLQAALRTVGGRGGGGRELAQGTLPLAALAEVTRLLQA